MKKQSEYYAAVFLREQLRQRAADLSAKLNRSVSRVSSWDLPCMEYGDEVQTEHRLAEELFYLQHCRTAVERCLGKGGALLRYKRADGSVTVTRFRLVGPNRIRVTGLQK